MGKFVDRAGQRFGRLLVVSQAGRSISKKVLWACLCDCGKETVVPSNSLVTGNTSSCGCLNTEVITKHGGYKRASYNTWRAMMRRCYNKKDKDYEKYGAVGVTVCADWHEYVRFAQDMGEPTGDETLDRIDPYGNYTPANCRWADSPTQARNTRLRKNSRSGHVGVYPYGDRWIAQITAMGKKYYSGLCNSIEEAISARKELERNYWGAV